MVMNYFELFDMTVQLKPDKQSLSRKFFELSRKHHPDYFVNETAEVRAEVLERSALLNKAFKTFRDDDETIKYVLQWKGLLEEEEKYQLSTGFLGEVLAINEALMDMKIDEDKSQVAKLGSLIKQLQEKIYEPVKEIIEHYQEGVTTEEELLQVKEYYYKKKYLDRIKHELAGMA